MIQLAAINRQLESAGSGDRIALTAVIDTALCVGAGGSSGSLADKPILKTANNQLVIPASQLKGRLRHECEKLTRALGWPTCESPIAQTMCPQRAGLTEQDFYIESYRVDDPPDGDAEEDERKRKYRYHCLICQLFGNPSLPSKLQFSDLVCTTEPDSIPEVLRPGVTINRRRRTAEEKKLYFLETSPANAALAFKGAITLAPNTPIFAKALILAGLKHIHALGGSKSAGLGWLHWESKVFENTEIEDSAWTFLGSANTSTVQTKKDTTTGGA